MNETYKYMPPHNLEAEQSLLGAMILSPDAIAQALEMVQPEDFYQNAHRAVFQALVELDRQGKPCDPVTLQETMRTTGTLAEIGGVSYLSHLMNVVPTAANAEFYARIVKEKSLLRHLILVSSDVARKAYDPQSIAEELLDEAEQRVLKLSQFRTTQPYVAVKSLVDDVFTQLERLAEHKLSVTGVPSGYTQLDEITAGFQNSDLIIVAARPSMGKTAFCLNIAQHAAHECQIPVLIFSLEMAMKQLGTRLMCSMARIDGQKLRRGFMSDDDWHKLTLTAGEMEKTPIFIDDTANASLFEIRSKARRAFTREKIGLIIIDYLQLISLPGTRGQENRQQEISTISRNLKGLARELDVPVICLSQLSRAVESRSDRRPMLSDLRESGAIEQDADVVIFLYRDSYYNPKKEESQNKAEIIVAKQRNGPINTCELAFFASFGRFENLAAGYVEPYD